MHKEGQLLCSHRVWQAYIKPKKPKKEKIQDYAICPGDPGALPVQCDPNAELTNELLAEQILLGMTNLTAEEFDAYKLAQKKQKKQKGPTANPGVLILQAEEANVPIGLGLGCWSSIASCFAINQVASVRLQ